MRSISGGGPSVRVCKYFFHDAFNILFDFDIPESQHHISVMGKQLVPDRIAISIFRQPMLATIDFNGQPAAMLDEIDDVVLKRNLPPEMKTPPIQFPQSFP
jgi:hypothetical protein